MYPKLKALYERNRKAASGMVVEIVRGVHAGNEDITPEAAAKKAMETAEHIITQLAPDGEDD